MVGEFTSRALMDNLQPQNFPTVMVLGDSSNGPTTAEEADTRAIIALLLLRDFRRRSGVKTQEVCSEILNPKNRELAATTEIHDIVISNEMVSMVLAQVSHEPRVRPVLEDLFQSEGSEIYLKPMSCYTTLDHPVSFEYLVLAAKARGEVALGYQVYVDDDSKRYGLVLNPKDRHATFSPKENDRLIVLAEDDG
jgi:CRISPR/Cas system-associated exonuclease Cas4 (RecB family)